MAARDGATAGLTHRGRIAALGPVDRARQWRWERQRQTPPRCPRRWTIGPPDFIGVGVQKAGTSWWYGLIARHPGVVDHGRPKELRYFGHRDRPLTQDELTGYARWFPRPPGALAGEWTPDYIHRGSPEEIVAAAPDAKLLVLLRDPVERYVSGLTMARHRGVGAVDQNFRRGLYAEALDRLFASIPKERVLVLQYERCVARPAVELARTYDFLGLDPDHTPRRLRRGSNVTLTEKVAIDERTRRELASRYRADARRTVELVPDLDLSLWPSVAAAGAGPP